MYYMYLGNMQIPIPPASMRTKINNRNKTIDLLGKGEVNIIKETGLTEISFRFLLPNSSYPFNQSLLMRSKFAPYYADELESLKVTKQPFQFITVRMKEGGAMINITNIKVTLEEYTIDEDADNGYDFYADVLLKKYVDFGAKRIEVKTDSEGNAQGKVTSERPTTGKTIATSAKASPGQTLQQIVKKELGNTNNLFAIAGLNKIAVPAILAVGQVVKLQDRTLGDKMVMH